MSDTTINETESLYKRDITLRRKQRLSDYKRVDAIGTLRKLLVGSHSRVTEIAGDITNKYRMMDLVCARMVLDAYENPNGVSVERIFNRIWGKPTETSINMSLSAEQIKKSPFAQAIIAAQASRIVNAEPISPSTGSLITNGRAQNEMTDQTPNGVDARNSDVNRPAADENGQRASVLIEVSSIHKSQEEIDREGAALKDQIANRFKNAYAKVDESMATVIDSIKKVEARGNSDELPTSGGRG